MFNPKNYNEILTVVMHVLLPNFTWNTSNWTLIMEIIVTIFGELHKIMKIISRWSSSWEYFDCITNSFQSATVLNTVICFSFSKFHALKNVLRILKNWINTNELIENALNLKNLSKLIRWVSFSKIFLCLKNICNSLMFLSWIFNDSINITFTFKPNFVLGIIIKTCLIVVVVVVYLDGPFINDQTMTSHPVPPSWGVSSVMNHQLTVISSIRKENMNDKCWAARNNGYYFNNKIVIIMTLTKTTTLVITIIIIIILF